MGNIKLIASVFIFASSIAISAQAERWIIKNPKQLSNIRGTYTQIKLANDYLVLETEESISRSELVQMFAAESAFSDLKITIDQPTYEFTRGDKGWHVEHLEYANLNPNFTGQGIIVAVLDTGVDYKHKALENKMWKNVNEIPNNSIDDDNNGLVDDYHGYNFNDKISDPKDTGSHGTHCAGIIAADVEPVTKAQGIAQGVKIMPLVIIGSDKMGFLADSAQAIKYAVDNGARVLSNSWRVYSSWQAYMNPEGAKLLEEAIAYAGEHKVIFAAAAGNERRNIDVTNLDDAIIPLSFTNLPNMIGIASSSMNGEEIISSFSNYGVKSVSVAAPGGDIYSTTPYGMWSMMSGTSMATPIVAGTLARGLSKGFTMEEAIENLNQTSKKTNYWQEYITHGRIDVKKYLE